MNGFNLDSHGDVEFQTPVTEWVALSTDPTKRDGTVLFDPGSDYAMVQMDQLFGPVEIVATGSELEVMPRYDSDTAFEDFDAEVGAVFEAAHRNAIFEWYDELVSEVLVDDIYDRTYRTVIVDGCAHATGIDVACLADEIASTTGLWDDPVGCARVAEGVSNWGSLSECADTYGLREVVFSAQVRLV